MLEKAKAYLFLQYTFSDYIYIGDVLDFPRSTTIFRKHVLAYIVENGIDSTLANLYRGYLNFFIINRFLFNEANLASLSALLF